MTALGLLLFILTATLPTLTQIRSFEDDLALERKAVAYLHDELYRLTYNMEPKQKIPSVNQKGAFLLKYEQHEDLIEGCISWRTHSGREKEVCLYG